jgi:hypothetical protein
MHNSKPEEPFISSEKRAEFAEIFKKVDKDNNGYLNHNEVID